MPPGRPAGRGYRKRAAFVLQIAGLLSLSSTPLRSSAAGVGQADGGDGTSTDGGSSSSSQQRPRCAVLYSGHVRSFAHPRVSLSHKKNLIEQLEIDCDVDVFMYLSVEDEVPGRYGKGTFADELAFTPYSPEQSAVDSATRLLKPVALQFHQDQAGHIPNGCEFRCEHNAFWQLYKMRAVYRMMEERELSSGQTYTWVMRSRLDIAWMLPIPPISRFPANRVTAGHNFFPLADQFLLMPRRFSATVFGTVSLCYACNTLKAQAESGLMAQTENLLRLVLRRDRVPFGFYEFPVVIVRNHEGGVCGVLHPYKLTCQLLHAGKLVDSATRCADVVNRWHRGACLEMFPPLPRDGDTSAQENVGDAEGGSRGVLGPATGGHGNDGERNDVERLDVSGACVSNTVASDAHDEGEGSDEGYFGRRAGGNAAAIRRKHGDDREVLASGNSVLSFDEATHRLDGMRRDLREMGEAIRVHVSPREDPFDFFGAHHYPFQNVDGGPLDYIATIAGFRLSEADFNAIALAFACLLSDVGLGNGATEEAGGEAQGSIRQAGERRPEEEVSPGGSRSGGTKSSGRLVLKTTAEARDVHAIVNCTLVNPLHDVSIALLDKEFEPSEVVCRGRVEPCLSRAQEEAAQKQ